MCIFINWMKNLHVSVIRSVWMTVRDFLDNDLTLHGSHPPSDFFFVDFEEVMCPVQKGRNLQMWDVRAKWVQDSRK